MILTRKSTAYEIWESLEKLFRDNKESKAIQLGNELRNIVIGDSSIINYCIRIKTIFDLLENIDSPIPVKKYGLIDAKWSLPEIPLHHHHHKISFFIAFIHGNLLNVASLRTTDDARSTKKNFNNALRSFVLSYCYYYSRSLSSI